MKVLVTGASGQLGNTFQQLVSEGYGRDIDFVFKTANELDVADYNVVRNELFASSYTHCINCAAYTDVDKAETENELAHTINVTGAKNLALNCSESKTVLIHISTDFVFDGFLSEPYTEDDVARPIGFYGDTKYKGERAVIGNLKEHFIIRTSWLYSEFGNNFLKTMIRLGNEQKELSVVYDQVGTPTYALDLAKAILHIIHSHSVGYGVYNYSNEGVASWYDFAKAIFDNAKIKIDLKPIRSKEYPTPAERPKFTVLDKSKIKHTFNLVIPHWKDSLKAAMSTKNLQAT